MALIKCNECSQEISDKASSCPNCGAPDIADRFEIIDKEQIQEKIDSEQNESEENQKKIVKKAGFFRRYFTYNDENITGASYFTRLFFALPLLCLMWVPGVYWIYIISYKRTRALNWNIAACHIISILNALLLPLAIGIPIHIVIWFGMFKVKK